MSHGVPLVLSSVVFPLKSSLLSISILYVGAAVHSPHSLSRILSSQPSWCSAVFLDVVAWVQPRSLPRSPCFWVRMICG